MLLSCGFSKFGILIGAAVYGLGGGIKTIMRGTLSLALFGHKGFGTRLGWIGSISMPVNATTPFVFTWFTQMSGGWWSFAIMALCVASAFLTYLKIHDPTKGITHDPT